MLADCTLPKIPKISTNRIDANSKVNFHNSGTVRTAADAMFTDVDFIYSVQDVLTMSSITDSRMTVVNLHQHLDKRLMLKHKDQLTQALTQCRKCIVKCSGPKDSLKSLAKLCHFSASPHDPLVYSNFELIHDDKCVELLYLKDKPAPTAKQTDDIGDHADNDIQRHSKKWHKPIDIEDVFDDCGDNLTSVELPEEENQYSIFSEGSSQFSDSVESINNTKYLYDSEFFRWYMVGSDIDETNSCNLAPPSTLLSFASFAEASQALHTKLKPYQYMDFMEIMGGKEGCTTIGIRRHMKTGQNMDLVTGFDLTSAKDTALLFKYIKQHEPNCIIMAPPCKAFGPWSNYNRIRNAVAWRRAYKLGRPLAALCAKVARLQLASGRHFICENPWSSALWRLPEWVSILLDPRSRFAYCDQCEFGLKDADGNHSMKPTAFVASADCLVRRLRRKCSRLHKHVHLAGSIHGINRTATAQIWPSRLCEAIVDGISELKH